MKWNLLRRVFVYERNYWLQTPFKHGIHTAAMCNGRFTDIFNKIFVSKTQKQIKQQEDDINNNNINDELVTKTKQKKKKKNKQTVTKKPTKKKQQRKLLTKSKNLHSLPDFLFNSQKSNNSNYNTKIANNNNGGKSNTRLPDVTFDPYISHKEYKKRKDIVTNTIRINPRNFRLAYVTNPNGEASEGDIVIESVEARNRAFPGDIVGVEILPREQWRDGGVTRTGKVVYLVQKKHSRMACGMIRPYRNHRFGFALFSPVDRRLPRVMIPLTECPQDFIDDPDKYKKILFIGNVTTWNEKIPFANGLITKNLGEAGLIEPETEAILINNDIDSSDFHEDVLKTLPDPATWRISDQELSKRRDFRDLCIFSVDPATARDLDDALSCQPLQDGTFEVGVHIADVSHFIKEGSLLDKVARDRATSVYLTQKVIPMLPSVLCEQLCSLNPGVERLAYSVVWTLDKNGQKLNEWFGRSVIRSCTKLSYGHAQQMIEANDIDLLRDSDFPEIDGGKFTLSQIANTVKNLYGIAMNLREQRFSSGALNFNETDIGFDLDKLTGMPNGCSLYEYKDSNRMIEEFMLLANMSVGDEIYKQDPKRAILRSHPPPHQALLQQVEEVCRKYDIPFDVSDSGSLSKSLTDLQTIDDGDDVDGERKATILPALNLLCMKSFKNAKYFCTGAVPDTTQYQHYALNIPIYTHFTSPIRRYPDILVHRLLTSSLDKSFKFKAKTKHLQMWAEHCTAKKLSADAASEQSSQLFLAVYIMEHGPLVEDGVVVNLTQNSVDVLCPQIGIISRVYFKDVDRIKNFKYTPDEEDRPSVEIQWKVNPSLDENVSSSSGSGIKIGVEFEQKFQRFSAIKVCLKVSRETPTKVIGQLIPEQEADSVDNLMEHARTPV